MNKQQNGNMYYSIIPNPYNDRGVHSLPQLPASISFIESKLIQLNTSLIFISNFDAEHTPRDFIGSYSLPVISARLLNEFNAMGIDSIQIFHAAIQGVNKSDYWTGYFAFNTLTTTSLELIADDSNNAEIIRLEKQKIFRISEIPSKLIVHESFVDHLSKTSPHEGWGISANELSEELKTDQATLELLNKKKGTKS